MSSSSQDEDLGREYLAVAREPESRWSFVVAMGSASFMLPMPDSIYISNHKTSRLIFPDLEI